MYTSLHLFLCSTINYCIQVQKKAARVGLDYVNTTAAHAELNAKQLSQCASFIKYAKEQLTSSPDNSYVRNTITWLESIPAAQELVKKVKG